VGEPPACLCTHPTIVSQHCWCRVVRTYMLPPAAMSIMVDRVRFEFGLGWRRGLDNGERGVQRWPGTPSADPPTGHLASLALLRMASTASHHCKRKVRWPMPANNAFLISSGAATDSSVTRNHVAYTLADIGVQRTFTRSAAPTLHPSA
jgi:hypothetical protein